MFHPQELAILFDYFGLERAAEAREADIHAAQDAVEDPNGPVLVLPNSSGWPSDLGIPNAVARLLLSHIQNRLPQWALVDSSGDVLLGRQHHQPPERKVLPLPQFLFEINWADSGPGMSWPEAYYVAHVAGFRRYVVTASADSTDAYGYTDFAIGWFTDEEDPVVGSKRIILERWKEYRDQYEHEGWAYLFGEGLVSEDEALAWKDEVWGRVQEEYEE